MALPKFIETSARADVYSRVTNRIVAELEQGVRRGSSRGTPSMPLAASPGRCAPTGSPTRASTF